MLLVVMGLLIVASLTIFGKFGITKSAKAEIIALYASIAALVWSIFSISISFSPQQSLNTMLPIIPKGSDWNSEPKFTPTLDFKLSDNTFSEAGLYSPNIDLNVDKSLSLDNYLNAYTRL